MAAEEQVRDWVEGYVRAWTTHSREDIAALFTPHAGYHERPDKTDWICHEAITAG
ncbi:hypothetical protein [Streptomyces celluloflavus]|uniref:hypothetical protein n=1 Tax=Streptomyces celluloflavus TaxID=58344 RepID=UPI00368E4C72